MKEKLEVAQSEEGMIPLTVTKKMMTEKKYKRRDQEAQREGEEADLEPQRGEKEVDLGVENHCHQKNPKEKIMIDAAEVGVETEMKGTEDLDLEINKKTRIKTRLEEKKKIQKHLVHPRKSQIF